MERTTFKDANGRKGGLGDWVRNLDTNELITVERIESHGHYGTTLASGGFLDRLDVKAKRAVIVKTAAEIADSEKWFEGAK